MSRRAVSYFVPGFIAAYVFVGALRWAVFQPEIFPISPFGMFQKVDKRYPDYDISVSRFRGRELVPPVSLRQRGNALGIELDGQALLVANGYAQFAERGELDKAARYRSFLEHSVIANDATYEILALERRSRPSERHREKEIRYGPFEAHPELASIDRDARFRFEPTKLKFGKQTQRGEVRRIKRRKSSR